MWVNILYVDNQTILCVLISAAVIRYEKKKKTETMTLDFLILMVVLCWL